MVYNIAHINRNIKSDYENNSDLTHWVFEMINNTDLNAESLCLKYL